MTASGANDHPANATAGDITRILDALRRGEELMLARQQPGHTLQATALVHEAEAFKKEEQK